MDLIVNGSHYGVDVPDEMPLLWVVRDILGLTGTKFGCGGSVQRLGDHAAFASCGSGVETGSNRWQKPEPSKPL